MNTQESNYCEKLVKLIEVHLRSTHLPTKMAAIYGTLYLLEANMTEVTSQVLPHVSEYLLRTLASITPYALNLTELVFASTMYLRRMYIATICILYIYSRTEHNYL